MKKSAGQANYAAYAPYYDLLYESKEYLAETRFVDARLRAAGVRRGTLLELGCGTGRHALALAAAGWSVCGIDQSPIMIERARRRARGGASGGRSMQFSVGDMRTLALRRRFDAVISLFHAFCYQTTNRDVHAALAVAASHVRPGGVFFFDFWFGPAVLSDPPRVRVKQVQDSRYAVTRIAEPRLDVERNLVEVRYDMFVTDARKPKPQRVQEVHRVRYFFLPELENLLTQHGFEPCGHGRWMQAKPLGADSWYGWIAARRGPEA